MTQSTQTIGPLRQRGGRPQGHVGHHAVPQRRTRWSCAGSPGCSGAFIATMALCEPQRTGGSCALVTMYIGGGQDIAAVFERM